MVISHTFGRDMCAFCLGVATDARYIMMRESHPEELRRLDCTQAKICVMRCILKSELRADTCSLGELEPGQLVSEDPLRKLRPGFRAITESYDKLFLYTNKIKGSTVLRLRCLVCY